MSAINILKEGEKEISALISHACLGKSYIFILFSLSTTRFCSESLSYLIILMTDKFSFFYLFFCKAFQRSSHKEDFFCGIDCFADDLNDGMKNTLNLIMKKILLLAVLD